jgi:uncharacterized protein (TIGR02677 family)
VDRAPEERTSGVAPSALRLLNQVAAFHYVTAPNAPTYRALVQAFHEAKQHYVIELRPAEVLERVRKANYHVEGQDEDGVRRHLDQLVAWGNLLRTHDPVAVSRIDDFYKGRYVYHLTSVGEAAHRAVLEVEATVGKSGSLQATMLVKIRDALVALAAAGATETLEPDALVRLFHDLHSAFDTLTEEANRFMGDLGRHTRGERVEEEYFVLYKQAVLAYISRFVEQLRHLAAEIAAGVQAVAATGAVRLIGAASRSSDLPPALPGTDPVAAWVGEQEGRWAGVCAWFMGDAVGHRPTIERLAEVAVDSVVELTRTLGRLNDRRTRPVDRAADFRALARWFSGCRDDEDAHRLWHAAFGLHSARHFHIEEDDPERTPALTSWWQGEPVHVPPRLRTRGDTSNSGRPSPAADYGREKEWIAQRRRRERAQLDVALARFAGRGTLSFAELVSLDAAELELLLGLLDEALSAPRETDGTRHVRTADGRLRVILSPPTAGAGFAAIVTPHGRLRCLDYRIAVEQAASLAVAVGDRR